MGRGKMGYKKALDYAIGQKRRSRELRAWEIKYADKYGTGGTYVVRYPIDEARNSNDVKNILLDWWGNEYLTELTQIKVREISNAEYLRRYRKEYPR